MAFEVECLEATLADLRARGVSFERFEMPGFDVRGRGGAPSPVRRIVPLFEDRPRASVSSVHYSASRSETLGEGCYRV